MLAALRAGTRPAAGLAEDPRRTPSRSGRYVRVS